MKTPYDLAQRFVDLKLTEKLGEQDEPFIVAFLALAGLPAAHDETAWCGAFTGFIAWCWRLPRPKLSAAARAWLTVGLPVVDEAAVPGYDVVILKRGGGDQPGADVTAGAPGHVGWFAGFDGNSVRVCGGNQSNTVSIAAFPRDRILGIRRLG